MVGDYRFLFSLTHLADLPETTATTILSKLTVDVGTVVAVAVVLVVVIVVMVTMVPQSQGPMLLVVLPFPLLQLHPCLRPLTGFRRITLSVFLFNRIVYNACQKGHTHEEGDGAAAASVNMYSKTFTSLSKSNRPAI